jgi:hypothetical protein
MAVINGVTIPLKDYPDGANGTGVYNAQAGGPFTYYTDKTNPKSITCDYMTRDFGKIRELFSSGVELWKNGV